jgi:hypothetical protein
VAVAASVDIPADPGCCTECTGLADYAGAGGGLAMSHMTMVQMSSWAPI